MDKNEKTITCKKKGEKTKTQVNTSWYKIYNLRHEILTNLYKKLKKLMKLNSQQHNDRWWNK